MTNIKNRISQVSYPSRYEIYFYRIFCFITAVFMLIYGLILKMIDPSAVELFEYRVIIAALHLLVFTTTFTKSIEIKKHIEGFVFISFTASMCLVSWLVYLNNFSSDYALGLLVTFGAITLVYHRPVLIFAHTIFSFVLIVVLVGLCDQLETSSGAIYLALIVVTATSFVSILFRIRFASKLKSLNQKLEQRVVDRTIELEENTLELVDKNFELEQIARVVSHDLKTPLSGIVYLSNLLSEDYENKLDENGKEMLFSIKDKAEYTFKLLEGIYAYRKIDEDKGNLREIDVAQLIQEVIKNNQLENVANIEIGKLPNIFFMKDHIYLVFDNLITNSIIHHHQKEDIKIEISCEEKDDFYIFRISDNGPGIEEIDAQRIFKLFETLKTKDEARTTGIGLALAKRIITKYGGELYLGQESKGATFYFTVKK